jgi:hypothetical protein
MSQTPIQHAESLHIGTVDFVSPDEVKVIIDIEAPESVALNAGSPRSFPRVNSYVLIPVDDGYLVGQIEWITVERSAFPKRRGMQDFGLVDLPYPLRKMSLNPLGTLRKKHSVSEEYGFRRGADALPSIGASVVLPTDIQLRSIVESGERKRVKIGTSPLAGNAEVCIDPDRLFGRHLAVLGNTGSGKSCSVAGLIRWSLEKSQVGRTIEPNARFIVLDPNGEYSRAFGNDDLSVKARIFKVNPSKGEFNLRVPLWFWNSAEWCSFTLAKGGTQRPVLRQALREVRAGRKSNDITEKEKKRLHLRRYLSAMLIQINAALTLGIEKSEESKFGFRLKAYSDDLANRKDEYGDYREELTKISAAISAAISATMKEYPPGNYYFRAFSQKLIHPIQSNLLALIDKLGGIIYQEGPAEDCPLQFEGGAFADQIELVGQQQNATQFVEFLVMRIRTMLADTGMSSIIGSDSGLTLEQWLVDYVGGCDLGKGTVSIIDLSLVPTEVIHLVIAVVARMVFEALQRYRKLNGITLPTVMVMEEAHTFIKHYKEDIESHDAAAVCCQVFERIACEGRKFGLGLVLSSQRPSELSQTVLSQCNSFLLHRISNDRDQELVHRLVPDNLRGLLRELPSLPSQNAILLGWASELPVLVKMNDLPKSQQPRSDDPDFWDVWTGEDSDGRVVERKANWKPIADDWQCPPRGDQKPEGGES